MPQEAPSIENFEVLGRSQPPDQTGTALVVDGDVNGVVNTAAYNLWKGNFGAHAGSCARTSAAVPEPAIFWLTILAAADGCLGHAGPHRKYHQLSTP